ncbi:unnamed protein product [Moneuplotes crassus]|uniref:Uncharacterized protein n=1 Tax=Euplotes crassus TaxID=5936 RepID=A0AAD1U5M0_EUPCR|nr:unnamed protein product [Moneuplotes crassus]
MKALPAVKSVTKNTGAYKDNLDKASTLMHDLDFRVQKKAKAKKKLRKRKFKKPKSKLKSGEAPLLFSIGHITQDEARKQEKKAIYAAIMKKIRDRILEKAGKLKEKSQSDDILIVEGTNSPQRMERIRTMMNFRKQTTQIKTPLQRTAEKFTRKYRQQTGNEASLDSEKPSKINIDLTQISFKNRHQKIESLADKEYSNLCILKRIRNKKTKKELMYEADSHKYNSFIQKIKRFSSEVHTRNGIVREAEAQAKSPIVRNPNIPETLCDPSISSWAMNPNQTIQNIWRKYDIAQKEVLPFCEYTPKITEINSPVMESKKKNGLDFGEKKSLTPNYFSGGGRKKSHSELKERTGFKKPNNFNLTYCGSEKIKAEKTRNGGQILTKNLILNRTQSRLKVKPKNCRKHSQEISPFSTHSVMSISNLQSTQSDLKRRARSKLRGGWNLSPFGLKEPVQSLKSLHQTSNLTPNRQLHTLNSIITKANVSSTNMINITPLKNFQKGKLKGPILTQAWSDGLSQGQAVAKLPFSFLRKVLISCRFCENAHNSVCRTCQ